MRFKDECFKKKHAKILAQNKINEKELHEIEHATWVYVKCSCCGEMYLIHFEKYLKNALVYKDWVCFRCEQKTIVNNLKKPHQLNEIYRGYHRVDEIIFADRTRFYIGYFSDGSLGGIVRRIVDQLGRKMYEVE
jgi:hypothetical protein